MSLEIEKKPGESSGSVVRRFSRALRNTGILRRAKEIRFYERPPSQARKKASALRGIEIQKRREEMRKLGKDVRR